MPDGFEIEPSADFNMDGESEYLVLAAARTSELAPPEILEEFGQDPDYGPRPGRLAVD